MRKLTKFERKELEVDGIVLLFLLIITGVISYGVYWIFKGLYYLIHWIGTLV